MPGPTTPLVVPRTAAERRALAGWLRRPVRPAGLVRRARAVLLVADGTSVSKTARLVGLTRKRVRHWLPRFLQHRMAGLEDNPGRGRKPVFSPCRRLASGQAGL